MKKKKNLLVDHQDVCETLREGDGENPNREDRSQYAYKPNHSARRLCKEARRALDLAIAIDVADPTLEGVSVCEVRPVSGAQVLQVVVTTRCADADQLDRIHAALNAASGTLRASLAASVRRKRVPMLRFRVVTEE
ncbi:MAG: ribosome-binding factor A [Verrucomicrobiales bacterium]|jgi:ribosome-binding factor A